MTKKITVDYEEKYQVFEACETDAFYGFTVSNKFLERFNKIQCIAEEMRDFIETKSDRANYRRNTKVKNNI